MEDMLYDVAVVDSSNTVVNIVVVDLSKENSWIQIDRHTLVLLQDSNVQIGQKYLGDFKFSDTVKEI